MMPGLDTWRRSALLAVGLGALVYTGMVRADLVPQTGTYLTGLGGDEINLLVDGTSNTIQLTDTTRVSACLHHVGGFPPTSPITDGSSNTIQFGPSLFLTLRVGLVLGSVPIGQIRDGTSNTILVSELVPGSGCFAGDTSIVDVGSAIVDGTSNTLELGEQSSFDICFRSARRGSVTDGTSNTIVFGEVETTPFCFESVRVAPVVADGNAVPEPGSLVLLAVALAGLTGQRRKA